LAQELDNSAEKSAEPCRNAHLTGSQRQEPRKTSPAYKLEKLKGSCYRRSCGTANEYADLARLGCYVKVMINKKNRMDYRPFNIATYLIHFGAMP